METNIASAQQLLRETGGEDDRTFEGASSHAKSALDEARQSLSTGVSGVATAAAGAMTGGLANQSAAASQSKIGNINGSDPTTKYSDNNGTLDVVGQAERMQLVDEEQKFNGEVSKYLDKWNLAEAGFAYDLCAVVGEHPYRQLQTAFDVTLSLTHSDNYAGSQSTGKSTLLNKLFGTSFDVMNETQRRQTTKGGSHYCW